MTIRFRQFMLCAAAVLTATTSGPAPLALAQRPSGDGEATAANCAALGFKDRNAVLNTTLQQRVPPAAYYAPAPAPMMMPAPPPGVAPPPPPPPPPPAPAPMRPATGSAPGDATVETLTVQVGALIRGAPQDSALPIEVYSRQNVQDLGSPTINELMRGISEIGAMGSGRTLVLQNGVRLSDGVTGSIPAAVPGTERYPDARPNAIHQTANEPVSTFSIDVDTASYSNVRRFLRDGQRPPQDAVRVEEMVNYFNYSYASPTDRSRPFASTVAVAPSPWNPGKQLVHIGVQGFRPAAGAEPPLNLVFLVDTSGSMSSADRLPLAQKSLNVLIDQLRPQDTVSMVVYAGSAGAVLAPTSGREKLKMRCAVNALQSGGSTAGGAGLNLAYALAQQNFNKDAVNRVILMTDGDFNVGTTDNKSLEQFVSEKRKTGVYLSIYGYGRGNYQDARMQTLAQNGNGTAAYVDSLQEARKLFRDDFTSSMFPIADDVKIQVEFNPAQVSEYRLVGYETRMLRREDFNNDRIDAGEVGAAGASVTAIYEITPAGGRASVDPLRYGEARPARPDQGRTAELANLRIRFKLPGQPTSQLIERPIGGRDIFGQLALAPESTRWAVAVAGYGQKLRGDAYVGDDYRWEQALDLAQGARGDDRDGQRAEFVNLVRAARDLAQRRAGL